MQIFKEANLHYDLNDADGSIKFCKRVNALITAMNSRTSKNSLRLDNQIYNVIIYKYKYYKSFYNVVIVTFITELIKF